MSIDFARLQEPFPSSQVGFRILRAGKSGDAIWAYAVAYLSATAIAERLDQAVGPESWRDEYRTWHCQEGKLSQLCGISLKIDGEWVTKWDGAEATQQDPIKGGLSAAFRRAAMKWGVGRYLHGIGEFKVRICPQGTEGAQYGNVNKKLPNGQWDKLTFYWLLPKLPDEALPASERGQRQARPQQQVSAPPPPASPPPPQSNPVTPAETTLGPEGKDGPLDEKLLHANTNSVALIDSVALAVQWAGALDTDPNLSVATKKAVVQLFPPRIAEIAANVTDIDEISRAATALSSHPEVSQWTKNQILPPLRKRFAELRSQLQPA